MLQPRLPKTLNSKGPLFAPNYSARKLSGLSSLAVPELDDSPIASGEAAIGDDSLFSEVGIPETSCRRNKKLTRGNWKKIREGF